MKPRFISQILLLCLLFAFSCQRSQDLAGNYKGAVPSDEKMELQIVLKSDGKGAWKVNRDEVAFFWEQKGDEVLLHLKSGGVIIGKRGAKDTIEISLPGIDNIKFTKAER